jgi:hypothetical protein
MVQLGCIVPGRGISKNERGQEAVLVSIGKIKGSRWGGFFMHIN